VGVGAAGVDPARVVAGQVVGQSVEPGVGRGGVVGREKRPQGGHPVGMGVQLDAAVVAGGPVAAVGGVGAGVGGQYRSGQRGAQFPDGLPGLFGE
jgi:hypothetical protein